MKQRKTQDGLPIVAEATFIKFVRGYDFSHNDPAITRRIEEENPQVHRVLSIGMQQAPTPAARAYYECGVQIAYELLRMQMVQDKK